MPKTRGSRFFDNNSSFSQMFHFSNFLPGSGKLEFLSPPITSPTTNVRVESGVVQKDEVSIFYDPMIAKLIVWDSHREKALARMNDALKNYQVGTIVCYPACLTTFSDNWFANKY
jgi:acetyl/propionyl-CoA carboxylase alpha subunit